MTRMTAALFLSASEPRGDAAKLHQGAETDYGNLLARTEQDNGDSSAAVTRKVRRLHVTVASLWYGMNAPVAGQFLRNWLCGPFGI